jgi:hypothetical protein
MAIEIGKKAFGASQTFRKGTIGAWREHFDMELKHLFHKLAGDYLIDLAMNQAILGADETVCLYN